MELSINVHMGLFFSSFFSLKWVFLTFFFVFSGFGIVCLFHNNGVVVHFSLFSDMGFLTFFLFMVTSFFFHFIIFSDVVFSHFLYIYGLIFLLFKSMGFLFFLFLSIYELSVYFY